MNQPHNTEELVNFQVALAKQVINKTQGMCNELQLAVYNNVCQDIRQHIENQRNGNNHKDDFPTTRQIEFAKRLGIKEPMQYRKQELSEKINKALKDGG